MSHPDFAVLTVSWELALRADGYADNTVKAYQKAVRSLADWLAQRHPEVGPIELDRRHIRGWLVERRESHSSNTARGWFAGVRHFCRWLQSEGETDQDATAGIRTPAPGDPETAVLSDQDLRALLATCTGTDFTARRDTAIIMLFLDGGLRLSELAGLQVADVDLRDRIVYVVGKASRRSGPRHRAVPLGVKAARALDRYGKTAPLIGLRTRIGVSLWMTGYGSADRPAHQRGLQGPLHRDSNPNRQIRSLVLGVGLVGSGWIWRAQVACLVDPDGSRRVPVGPAGDQAVPAAGGSVAGRPHPGPSAAPATGSQGTEVHPLRVMPLNPRQSRIASTDPQIAGEPTPPGGGDQMRRRR